MENRTLSLSLAALVLFFAGSAAAEERTSQTLSAKVAENAVEVHVDGKLFTAYKFAHDQKYPYFYPVAGPLSGKSVTTESSEPYPHHHSLFFGCDKVNGGNYWQDVNRRGQILSQGPKLLEASGARVVFTDECLWERPRKDPVIRGTRRVTITAPSDKLRRIDFEITLDPLTDIDVEKTNHSLFSARVRAELNVESGGTLVNAEGQQSHEGTHEKPSPWCDYSGTENGITEGIAILQHPGNRWYPSPWFTRDYGFFSPTPLNWEELHLKKGEKLTLRYRVIVHSGDVKEADIAGLFAEYLKEVSANT